MARPAELLPGDILLYRNHGWLGGALSWGSWGNQAREALEYSHVGFVLDFERSAEMNPPCSRAFPLSEVPWDRVDVYRVLKEGEAAFNFPAAWDIIKRLTENRLGERYAYGYIAQSLGASLLARIGLSSASRWLVGRSNPLSVQGRDVCSTWAEEILSDAVRALYSDPAFDLFPDLGRDRAKPSDFPRSPFIQRIS